MVKRILYAFFLTMPIMGIISWLVPLTSLMVIMLFFIWLLWIWVLNGWKREMKINQLDEEMYYWLQNFITTLSIKKTITETFVDLSQRYQLKETNWLKSYTSNEVMQTMINLKQRFHHPIYEIFTSTLGFYEQQGGDVMTLFDSILFQTRLMETRRIEVYRYTKRYFFQWLFLWMLNLLILVLSKLILMDLFAMMKNTLIFQVLIVVILVLIPISKLIWFYQWVQVKQKIR